MKQNIILPPASNMPVESSSFFRWIGFFLSPYKATFITFFSFRVVRYTILSMLPLMMGLIINGFEKGWAFAEPEKLVLMIAVFLCLYGAALASISLFFFEARAEDKTVRGLTLFSVGHMNALPLTWHEAQGSGSKLQRIMQARSSLKQLFMIYKWSVVPFIGSALAIFISIAMMDAPHFFFLMFAGFVGTFFAAAWWTAKPLPELHNRHNAVLERLMSGVYEFVSAVRTVKAFHMGEYIEREALRYEREGHGAMTLVYRASYWKWTILNTIGFLWMAGFIVICTMGVYHHWLSAGAFAAIFFLANNLWMRLEEMVYMQDQFLEFRNGFMRLTETLKAPPVNYDMAPISRLPENWSSLHFDHVDFAYDGADEKSPPALHDIHLSIRRGEKIALIGRSGAGKSTFIKLLMKQALPAKGEIRLDDLSLNSVASSDWLSSIGFVPQDVELFNMNIRDNILLDRSYEENADIYNRALKQAALDQLIADLPQGDQTMVGERGIKLSGGQRQRLGIARALVRDADLIIFDEATASLDSLSEQVIQNALMSAFAGRTMLIIAHRLSTVRFADRIIVLENGHIAEQGSFDDLIRLGGKFATLWAMQSSGFVDDDAARERPDEVTGLNANMVAV